MHQYRQWRGTLCWPPIDLQKFFKPSCEFESRLLRHPPPKFQSLAGLRCILTVFPWVILGISVERRPWSADMPVLPQKSLLGKEHGAVSGVYRELTGNLSV